MLGSSQIIVVPRELKYVFLMLLIYVSKSDLYIWGHEYNPFDRSKLRRTALASVSKLAKRNAYYFPSDKEEGHVLYNSKSVCAYGDKKVRANNSSLHFIYIGRIYKEKGFAQILRYFEKNSTYRLDVVSPDEPRTQLPNVDWLGEITDLSALRQDKYHFAISGGALGLNILDYFSIGCPIIRLNDDHNGPEQWYLSKLRPASVTMTLENYNYLVTAQYNLLTIYSLEFMVSNFKSFCFD